MRPIAIGEVFRRITAKVICSDKQTEFHFFFCSIQHGVATEGGVEHIFHQAQAMIEQHPDWVILKSDIKNAVNSISRKHMLQQDVIIFRTCIHMLLTCMVMSAHLCIIRAIVLSSSSCKKKSIEETLLAPLYFPLLYNNYSLRRRSNIPEFKLGPIWMTSF